MNKYEKADITILIGYYSNSLAFFELKKILCRSYCTGQPTLIRRHLSPHAQQPLGEVVEFKPGVVWNVHRKKGRWDQT